MRSDSRDTLIRTLAGQGLVQRKADQAHVGQAPDRKGVAGRHRQDGIPVALSSLDSHRLSRLLGTINE
jgi:hypothetical protein